MIDWQFDPAGPLAARFVDSTSVVPGEEIGKLKAGHGAWMAEIVSQVAPEARIIPIHERSLKQQDYQAFLIAGIRYAADYEAAVVTSSMGPIIQSQALREAIDEAEDRGTIIVDVHPELIVRGDSTPVPRVAGACDARIVHTGVGSVLEHPTSPEASRELYTWPYALAVRYRDGWGYSTAPPIVSGVITLRRSANPDLLPSEVRQVLRSTAETRDGFPVVDAYAAIRAARATRTNSLLPSKPVRP